MFAKTVVVALIAMGFFQPTGLVYLLALVAMVGIFWVLITIPEHIESTLILKKEIQRARQRRQEQERVHHAHTHAS